MERRGFLAGLLAVPIMPAVPAVGLETRVRGTSIEAIVADLERRHGVGEAWDGRLGRGGSETVTGDEYVELVCGGVKPECEQSALLCGTRERAVEEWWKALAGYEAGRFGKVYWRIRPELDSWDAPYLWDGKPLEGPHLTWWGVYSRLFIARV